MNEAKFVAVLLGHPLVKALVGANSAMGQLRQGATLPGLVYQLVTSQDRPYIDQWGRQGLRIIRVQVNPLAMTVDGVQAIYEAVDGVIHDARNTEINGARLIQVEKGVRGPFDKDPVSGAWTRSADYLLTIEPV